MALSGSKSVVATSHDTLKFSWTATQSIDDNTSTVSWKMQLIAEDYGRIESSASKDWKVIVNGVSYSGTNKIGIDDNETLTLASGTTKITHGADGTKTFSYSFSQEFAITWGSDKIGTVSGSGSGTLDTIPRATTPTLNATSVNLGSAITVSMPRASSAFTHTLKYTFGSTSGTIASSLGTSYSWTVPLTLANQIPKATSGTVTITCYTYKGSTLIGSKSVKFTANVPTSVVPTISSVTIADTNSTQNTKFGGFVKNHSSAKVTIVASGSYGSTISSYSTKVGGYSFSGSTVTVNSLTTAGTLTFTITVKDSRGRTATTTKSITVLDYANPIINSLTVVRANSDGTANDEGTCLLIKYKFAISSVNSKNDKTYKLEIKASGESSYTSVATGNVYSIDTSKVVSSNISVDKSYDVRLTITDYFKTVTRSIEAPTAFTLIDFHSSGKGLAFGKVAQKEGVIEMGLPVEFENGEVPNGATEILSGTDLDTLLKPGYYVFSGAVSTTLLNMPFTTAGSGSVEIIREGESNQVRQVVTCCSIERGVWERLYYSNAWHEWTCVFRGGNRVLWSGAYYMQASHTVTLSPKVSEQVNGIVLVFSRYTDGTVRDYQFNSFFVSKEFIALEPGAGMSFLLGTDGLFNAMGAKYLYIHDDKIVGHANNVATGTGSSGIKYENNTFVLRYVIGV